VLYCRVLYTIFLYCIVLYCIVLCCLVLSCTVSCCIVLYCVVLYCVVLYCIVLCRIVLCCRVLSSCIVLYCSVVFCVARYCIVLSCTVLYCSAAPTSAASHPTAPHTCAHTGVFPRLGDARSSWSVSLRTGAKEDSEVRGGGRSDFRGKRKRRRREEGWAEGEGAREPQLNVILRFSPGPWSALLRRGLAGRRFQATSSVAFGSSAATSPCRAPPYTRFFHSENHAC
jgi:hypothetical protein